VADSPALDEPADSSTTPSDDTEPDLVADSPALDEPAESLESAAPDEPDEPDEPAAPAETPEHETQHAPDPPNSRGVVGRALAKRRRALPWSNGVILLASLVLVIVLVPLWLDPLTLSQVAGQAVSYSPLPSPTVAVAPSAAGPTAGPSPLETLAATDDFTPDQFDSWGSADLGGQYVASGAGVLSVEEGSAFVRLRAADAGAVLLPSLAVADVALEYAMSMDRVPADGHLTVFALLRAANDDSGYRLGIRIDAAGNVEATAGSLVDGVSKQIGSRVLIPITRGVAPPAIWVRAEAVGSDPTTLRMRAWADGQAEPGTWQLSVIDWTGALQVSGSAGLAWRLDSTMDDQLALAFDEISVWRLTGDRP
jgi:hypothetical protein